MNEPPKVCKVPLYPGQNSLGLEHRIGQKGSLKQKLIKRSIHIVRFELNIVQNCYFGFITTRKRESLSAEHFSWR